MITFQDVLAAHDRIRPFIHRTPVATSRYFDNRFGGALFIKCEHFQKVGAFKARGACNAVRMLDDAAALRGVATHSSGNHAQAVAWSARHRNIPSWIVMPTNAPDVKKAAVRGYGATIVECEPTLAAREATLADVVERTGAHAIHPYNDDRVIAGQGTAALELLEDVPDLDIIMTPVGGGGLMSGTAITARAMRADIELIGAEPASADDARRSLATGILQPPPDTATIADGLRTALGERTFDVLRSADVRILTATEESIREAQYLVMERMKMVVEPSATVTLGILLENPTLARGKRIGIVTTGGNVDIRKAMHF